MSFDSDIVLNITPAEESMQQEGLTRKQKKKEKWFNKKKQALNKNGFLGKHKYGHSRPDLTSHQHGAPANSSATPDTHFPHRVSVSHCSSTPSASLHQTPSAADTVKEKTNVSTDTKPPPPGPSVGPTSCPPAASRPALPSKCVALDCEMVGAGPKGSINQLARCSIVSYEGDVVYDKYIIPALPVTDYRTRWSGIRRRDLVKATPYDEARKEILKLLMGKVVIGHAIQNDLKILGYTHPAALTRDTSTMMILNKKAGFTERCVSLKRLTKAIFNRNIQTGRKGHCSVEDAKASMELYKVVEEELERSLESKFKV
ncbi:interferon-stimulated 20 kDa exonuclease-like 2 [Gouania willdenowi]|uniref:Exonuclease domain-containing protein n=1 Tax=Gouania willdenowi TaxID=441366 RepID=A0A8C5GYB3_GOUWI|nr:interferon-stimulated 20 kDa exonuclease-like 2 [Gouania willdenowi]